MRKFFERISEWGLRLVLLPVGVYFAWHALTAFMGTSPDAVQSAFPAVVSILLLWAAIYPAPPWKNEPFKMLIKAIGIFVIVFAWFVGSGFGAQYLTDFLFGKNPTFEGLLFFLSLLLIWGAQYLVYNGMNLLWHKVYMKANNADE